MLCSLGSLRYEEFKPGWGQRGTTNKPRHLSSEERTFSRLYSQVTVLGMEQQPLFESPEGENPCHPATPSPFRNCHEETSVQWCGARMHRIPMNPKGGGAPLANRA